MPRPIGASAVAASGMLCGLLSGPALIAQRWRASLGRLGSLIGTPLTRLSVLRNLAPDSQRYDQKDPSKNYSLVGFDERARSTSGWRSSR